MGFSKTSVRAIWLLIIAQGAGCRLLHTTTQLPAKAVTAVTPGSKKPNIDVVEVQANLLRFADEYSGQMLVGLERIQRGSNAPNEVAALRWKIRMATQVSSIVSGPNPIANLLDMTVFVTAGRMAAEQRGETELLGTSIQPIIESCRRAEAEIWRQAAAILPPEQQNELRAAIEEWYRQNPLPGSALAARAVGFASQLQQGVGKAKAGGVFDLLNLDPMAGLDPAMREIAQTRMFAERALYVAHRTPELLRWQAELMAMEATEIPAMQQLLTNSTQLSSSVERFAGVAERLPGQMSAEREEILKALETQEPGLKLLTEEVKEALLAGSQMSTSLNTTLTTFDGLMKRFGVGETNISSEPKTNAEPFRIQDYTASAAQLEATARQLTELLATLDRTVGSSNAEQLSAQADQVIQQAQLNGKALVNYIFLKALFFLVLALVLLLIYRAVAAWLTRRGLFNLPGA